MEVGTASMLSSKLNNIEASYENYDAAQLQDALNFLAKKLSRAEKDLKNWDKKPSDIAVIWALTAVDKSYLREIIARLISLIRRINTRLEAIKAVA